MATSEHLKLATFGFQHQKEGPAAFRLCNTSTMASALDTGTSGSTPVGYHDLPWPSAASGTPGLLERSHAGEAQLIMKDCLQPSHIHTSLRKELHLFAMECLHHGQKRGKIAAQCNAKDNLLRRLCRSRSCLRRCGSRCRQSCIYAGAGIAGLLPCCAVFGRT